MNDAHVYEMQVQMWKPNTRGVTIDVRECVQFLFLLMVEQLSFEWLDDCHDEQCLIWIFGMIVMTCGHVHSHLV